MRRGSRLAPCCFQGLARSIIDKGRYAVCPIAQLAEGQSVQARVGDGLIAVFNVKGKLHALADVCSHAQAFLSEGEVSLGAIACPRHGARFDLETGEALSLPATQPVATFPVEVADGEVIVTVA